MAGNGGGGALADVRRLRADLATTESAGDVDGAASAGWALANALADAENAGVPAPGAVVWVAVVDTRYETVAVAGTERGAIVAACERALQFLHAGGNAAGVFSASEVEEFFGVGATAVPFGGATLVGLGEFGGRV